MLIWTNFLHFYQPPTQKKYWIDRVTNESYRKIVKHLLANNKARLTLNINAVLCELWEQNGHQDVIDGVKALVHRGQIELTGSAKYHPLLPKLPDSEVERQVYLNELGLNKYFGVSGPLLKHKGPVKLRGFFPPEMAYSPHLSDKLAEMGYEWVILDELSYSKKLGQVDYNKIYRDKGSKILTHFRNRDASFKILSGQLSTPALFMAEFGHYAAENKYLLTAMDGETFGHHRPGLDETLAQLYTNSGLKALTISELSQAVEDEVEIDTLPSTWALMEKDAMTNVPFARWEDNDNEIHHMQWRLAKLAIRLVNGSKFAVSGVGYVGYSGMGQSESAAGSGGENTAGTDGERSWKKSRELLDRALHSDQFWWASAKPWWSLEMVERGAKDLLDAINLVPDAGGGEKNEAKELYYGIITAGFEWQRSGKVDEISKKNDEEIIMAIDEELGRYTDEQIQEMIKIQQREMEALAKNLEFERAVHPRNRIGELREYLTKKSQS
ncbi:hypothetical protein HY419_00500 [candidate division WWE3 bacterium]|nr:hypothetical protein [candidate division WWE3 bacterium]